MSQETDEGGDEEGDELPPISRVEERRRETLGGSYLSQALDELRSSGSSDALYPRHALPLGIPEKQRMLFLAAGTNIARTRRVEFARAATLYSILAAEAYANQYLQWHLSGAEFQAADRLPTFDKYLLGPRLVRGTDLLVRGEEPAQTLRKLLSLRTPLVHPKLLPAVPQRGAGADPPEFEDFNPRDAARYLVAVADAAGWLLANSSPTPHFDFVVATIDMEKDYFLAYGATEKERLASHGSDPAPDLLYEAMSRVADRRTASRRASE